MESYHKIDEIDKRILKFLQKDAKIPLRKIADEVGKTETTIRRRIKALEDKKIISRYTIQVSLPSKEKKIKTFLRIDQNISKTKDIADKLSEFSEIDYLYFMSGECGIWVRANFIDISHLDNFLKANLGKIDGIKRVINCIILSEMQINLKDLR